MRVHSAWRVRACVGAAVLTALVMGGAGCERRSDTPAPQPGAAAARMVVTGDFGATPLLDRRVPPTGSVMDGLRAVTPVRTAYGGGFVAGMLGRDTDASGQRAWLFWVDGILADRGAGDVRLRAGRVVWWDHHPWGGLADPWAVVGAWPLPFSSAPGVSADAPLDVPLRAAGARLRAGDPPWRVRVGSDASLRRRDPAWARAARDPAAAGLSATITDGLVRVLRPDGSGFTPVPGAAAIAVAVPTADVPARGVLLAVVGADDAAALAAARTIAAHPQVLGLRMAVAFTADGTPVRASGRSTP